MLLAMNHLKKILGMGLFLCCVSCQKKAERVPKEQNTSSVTSSVQMLTEETRYQVQMTTEVHSTKNQKVVRVFPKPPYHINPQYPTSLTLKPSTELNIPNTVLVPNQVEFTEKELTFPGVDWRETKVPVELRFAVCTESTCEPVKISLVL